MSEAPLDRGNTLADLADDVLDLLSQAEGRVYGERRDGRTDPPALSLTRLMAELRQRGAAYLDLASGRRWRIGGGGRGERTLLDGLALSGFRVYRLRGDGSEEEWRPDEPRRWQELAPRGTSILGRYVELGP